MNKLLTKIVGACLGVAMATGVGVGVAVGSQDRGIKKAEATGISFEGNSVAFVDLGLTNTQQYLEPFASEVFSIVFSGGSNDGKYYDTGTGIRTYGGGSFTITGISGTLTQIDFTWDGSYKPTSGDVADSGTFSSPYTTWNGETDEVTFTRPSGSGHWRLKSVAVTVSSSNISWDLTVDETASNSEAETKWTSNYATMTWSQNGGTKTNNYLGGFSGHTDSRIYNHNILTISAQSGYALTGVKITTLNDTLNDYKGLMGDWNADEDTVTPTRNSSLKTISVTSSAEVSAFSITCTATTKLVGVSVFYVESESATSVSTSIAWKTEKTYFTGNYSNTLSTNDFNVYENDEDGGVCASHLLGSGFILKIYKNDVLTFTLDATSSVQTQSFVGLDASSQSVVWKVNAVVGTLAESSYITFTVVNKEITGLSWAENHEQTGTFVSYGQKLHIDGQIYGTFNDGSTSQDHHITTEIYSGSAATAANLIYSVDYTRSTHNAGHDITHANQEGKTLLVDDGGRLAYSSATTFYIQMYYTDFPQYKVGKVVNVVLPTLYAEDANSFNYYVGTTRTTAANVSLKYNNAVVRELDASEYTLDPVSVTPTNTNPISVSVVFKNNNVINTTYTITPVEAASLELFELFDNSGSSMTDKTDFVAFEAGDQFHLFNKAGETYFGYALDSDFNEYLISDYSDLSFELLDTATALDGSGTQITTSTYMRKSMSEKWIRATYSQGSSSVQLTYQLDIEDAVIAAYSEGEEGDYEKVTSISGVTSGDYIITYTNRAFDGRDAENGYTEVAISNNKITYSADMAKLAVHIESVEGGFVLQLSASNVDNPNKYVSFTTNKNSLSFSDTPKIMSIDVSTSSTHVNYASDKFAIGDSNTYLSYNANTSSANRFRFYKPGTTADTNNGKNYYPAELYKRASSGSQGDKITYLKQVIDAYRLNNDTNVSGEGISICEAHTGIYESDYWKGTNGKVSVKTLFQSLTDAELAHLGTQDLFGETGKTYVDTYEMLIAKEPVTSGLRNIFNISSDGAITISTVIVIFSVLSFTTLGGYFLLRKKKEER